MDFSGSSGSSCRGMTRSLGCPVNIIVGAGSCGSSARGVFSAGFCAAPAGGFTGGFFGRDFTGFAGAPEGFPAGAVGFAGFAEFTAGFCVFTACFCAAGFAAPVAGFGVFAACFGAFPTGFGAFPTGFAVLTAGFAVFTGGLGAAAGAAFPAVLVGVLGTGFFAAALVLGSTAFLAASCARTVFAPHTLQKRASSLSSAPHLSHTIAITSLNQRKSCCGGIKEGRAVPGRRLRSPGRRRTRR